MIFLGIVLILCGLFMLFKTELFWKLTEQWTSNDATEPSDLYIFNTKFGGIICTLVGAISILASIFDWFS
jgi:uncharacterized membrane protein